jgi:hypothetical protein
MAWGACRLKPSVAPNHRLWYPALEVVHELEDEGLLLGLAVGGFARNLRQPNGLVGKCAVVLSRRVENTQQDRKLQQVIKHTQRKRNKIKIINIATDHHNL